MEELTPFDKKNIERLKNQIEELNSIEKPEEFTTWQSRIEVVLMSLLKKKDGYIVDEICTIEATDGRTNIPRLNAAKRDARKMLETVIEHIETAILKPKKEKGKKAKNIALNVNVTQEVQQQVDIQLSFLMESINDNFTQEEREKLKEIANSKLSFEEKKKGILNIIGNKALDFGVALAANPDVWKLFGKLFVKN